MLQFGELKWGFIPSPQPGGPTRSDTLRNYALIRRFIPLPDFILQRWYEKVVSFCALLSVGGRRCGVLRLGWASIVFYSQLLVTITGIRGVVLLRECLREKLRVLRPALWEEDLCRHRLIVARSVVLIEKSIWLL